MSTRLGPMRGIAPLLLVIMIGLAGCRSEPQAAESPSPPESANTLPVSFTLMNVTLPAGKGIFPAGKGSELANAQCLGCHSIDMVLVQPPLTVQEWQTEVTKMRTAFGAPIPAEQTDALAQYLRSINGRDADAPASGPGKLSH